MTECIQDQAEWGKRNGYPQSFFQRLEGTPALFSRGWSGWRRVEERADQGGVSCINVRKSECHIAPERMMLYPV